MTSWLLDTHALLWWLADDPTLDDDVATTIDEARVPVVVSVVSLWEVAVKEAIGKLDAPDELEARLEEAGFEVLPVLARHVRALRGLPRHHDDPFDRMLVAQATAEDDHVLVSRDRRLADYAVALRRC